MGSTRAANVAQALGLDREPELIAIVGSGAVLINKVETEAQRAAAERVAQAVLLELVVERVVIGALAGGVGRGWEIRRHASRRGATA